MTNYWATYNFLPSPLEHHWQAKLCNLFYTLTINGPHLPYKIGLDVMQSHPLHRTCFCQYQASSAALGWQGAGDCRPLGTKFEMVRPYYSAKCAHYVLQPQQTESFGWQLSSEVPASIATLEQQLNNPPKLIRHFCVGWLAEYWSGGRRTCRTCSYGPGLLSHA